MHKIITAITIKMLSIPVPIYFKLAIKFIGLKFIFSHLVYFKKKLSIKPPAITEAICPDTFTPIECIRRKF